jgi:hypothetical protein
MDGSVDLVIAVNYASTALITIAKAELPTLLFWKAPLLDPWPEGLPSQDLFKQMGEFIRCDDSLIETIERVRTNETYTAHLKSLSRSFKERYLSTNDYQTIEEFIFELGKSFKT